MNKFYMAALITISLLGNVAQAEVQKAPNNINQMVKTCMDMQDEFANAVCQGFVLGVINSTRLYGSTRQITPVFCVPKDESVDDILEAYRTYLRKNRAIKHFPAAALAIAAFETAYPCD